MTTRQAQHTPVPWAIGRHDTSIQAADGYEVADTAGVHLHQEYDADKGHWASTPGAERNIPQAEEAANAAFIVRACNSHAALLAAAKAAYHALQNGQNYRPLGTNEAAGQLRAAIAGATGGQP